MMLRTDADHLPAPVREELLHVATILFEAFEETTKGRCSEHFYLFSLDCNILFKQFAGLARDLLVLGFI